MTAHERVSTAISAANESGRTALVPFITAGYPEPKTFVSTLKTVAEVGDVAEPEIVDESQYVRGCFHDHRTLFQVQPEKQIDHGGVGRQQLHLGVHARPDDRGFVVRPILPNAVSESGQ